TSPGRATRCRLRGLALQCRGSTVRVRGRVEHPAHRGGRGVRVMSRQGTVWTLGLVALALASATLRLWAQQPTDRPEPPSQRPPGRSSVQDALTQPFSFTFARPTSIQDVAAHLAKALKAPVAVDRAALDRLGLKPDDTVQLELEGVRLKTGLKLLLDQLDMSY